MTLTQQIERLENERSELLADMRGINPKLSSYRERQSKCDKLMAQIKALGEERAATWVGDESNPVGVGRRSGSGRARLHSRAS